MPTIRTFTTVEASSAGLREIRAVLVAAFDGAFSDDDWEHTIGGWHVVALEDGRVVSHGAVVPRTLEVGRTPLLTGYVEGMATVPGRQRQRLGSTVCTELSRLVRNRFDMGALSTDRHRFYARWGWERWRGPTFVKRGHDLVRTPDEDDGVMVLRFGRSQDIDLAAALSCESRAGDDW